MTNQPMRQATYVGRLPQLKGQTAILKEVAHGRCLARFDTAPGYNSGWVDFAEGDFDIQPLPGEDLT